MCVLDSSGDEVDYKNIEACQLEISTTNEKRMNRKQKLIIRLNEELKLYKERRPPFVHKWATAF